MTLTPKILVVSDLQTASPLESLSLTQARWDITLEPDPARAVERWAELLPDLIVCDIQSDAVSLETVTNLREHAVIPILLLTSNHANSFILDAYEAGVDECVLKPIEPMLFEVKLRAWLRHSSNVPVDLLDAIKVEEFHLIPADRVVVLNQKDPIHLTHLELRLLYYLMGRPGRTLTTEELCHYVWSHHSAGDPVMLKSLVYRLRRKIETDPANPNYVHTVAGVGYRFLVK